MNSLIISTECPSCGASLDFTEGSNAVKCGHCGSNLLVTGRKQILSYYVPPKLEERRAIAEAVKVQRDRGRNGFVGVKAHLYFLPYYRMTGQDLGLEKALTKSKNEDSEISEDYEDGGSSWMTGYNSPSVLDEGHSFSDAAGEALSFLIDKTLGMRSGNPRGSLPRQNFGDPANQDDRTTETCGKGGLPPYRGSLYEIGEVFLNDRYIEKNFIACDLHGIGLYSLGVRPAVLKLELFRKAALDSIGKTVSPDLSPEAAESVGLKTASNSASLYRKVIGKVLSIIYFPFWVIEMENQGKIIVTIIDAISESVIKADADPSIYKSLNREAADSSPTIINFRPLICPNCGWDLPVRPDDSIFFCGGCGRAWQISGNRLSEVSYHIAEMGIPVKEANIKYLPFWILMRSPNKERPFKYFIPAFRYRRLKFLLDIALQVSRLQPSYSIIDLQQPNMSGCYYDSEDAFLMAQFTQSILASERIEKFKTGDDLSITESALAWLPFEMHGEYLTSSIGGLNIPKGLLL